MLSFIGLNWKGQLLLSYMSIVNLNLTQASQAMTDLRIKAVLSTPVYGAGVKVANAETGPNECSISQLHRPGTTRFRQVLTLKKSKLYSGGGPKLMLSGNPSNGTNPFHNQYWIPTPLRRVRGAGFGNHRRILNEHNGTFLGRFWFKPARRSGGRDVSRNLFAYSTGILIAFLLVAFSTPSSAYASNAVDSYVTSVLQLLQRHRAGLPRLIAPANATANALIHGGAFYLGGDKGWVAEGLGRAGGLMMVRRLSSSNPPVKGDVVWLAYTPKTYSEVEQQAKELEGKGCLVVAFGPRLASGPPDFTHWIDSYTSPTAADNFTEMGNIISLWSLTGEVAASTARAGKTLVFWQSIDIWGSNIRNRMYRGMAFHTGFPQMKPIPPGVLSEKFIFYLQTMIENIREWELPKIVRVGHEMARRAAQGHPAGLMVMSHLMPYLLNPNTKLYRYVSIYKHRDDIASELHRGGLLIFIGYVGVYSDILRDVREAGARAVWIISPLHTEVHYSQFGDIVINQHWRPGDCAVEAPGYDIRILPPSAVAQLFIYETMMRAAGAH